jgi:hypothetical protein
MSDLEVDIRAKLNFCRKNSYNLDKTESKLLQVLKGDNNKPLTV